MEHGNIPKLWPSGTQVLSPRKPGTAEYLALEICSGSKNLHFMVLSSYSHDYGVEKLGQAEFLGRLGIPAACGKQGSVSGCSRTKAYT